MCNVRYVTIPWSCVTLSLISEEYMEENQEEDNEKNAETMVNSALLTLTLTLTLTLILPSTLIRNSQEPDQEAAGARNAP